MCAGGGAGRAGEVTPGRQLDAMGDPARPMTSVASARAQAMPTIALPTRKPKRREPLVDFCADPPSHGRSCDLNRRIRAEPSYLPSSLFAVVVRLRTGMSLFFAIGDVANPSDVARFQGQMAEFERLS